MWRYLTVGECSWRYLWPYFLVIYKRKFLVWDHRVVARCMILLCYQVSHVFLFKRFEFFGGRGGRGHLVMVENPRLIVTGCIWHPRVTFNVKGMLSGRHATSSPSNWRLTFLLGQAMNGLIQGWQSISPSIGGHLWLSPLLWVFQCCRRIQRFGLFPLSIATLMFVMDEKVLLFYMCTYLFMDVHVHFHLDEFITGVLRVLYVVPIQLHTNNWTFLQAFCLSCDMFYLSPSPKVFMHFYSTQPSNLIRWLSLVSQLSTCLFTPFTLSCKIFF